jgi:hypothetical protein
MTRALFATVCLAGLLAACAQQEWQKPQADAAQRDIDLKLCQTMAGQRANRFAPPDRGIQTGLDARDPLRSPDERIRPDRLYPDRQNTQLAQAQDETWCMRDKGYTLEPVK